MPKSTEQTATDTTPRGLGLITSMIGKAFAHMSPEERRTLIADASAVSKTAIGKAEETLNIQGGGTEIGVIEDLWDGAPDTMPPITSAHGPGSSTNGIAVGPSQSMSGDGAPKMERQYSQFATQTGVQRATEMLGRKLVGLHKAMSSLVEGMQAMGLQLDALKAASETATAPVKLEDVQTMVAKAVNEAVGTALGDLRRSVSKAVKVELAKAEKESESEKGDDDEEEDEESDESQRGGHGDVEITTEVEEEDDDDKKESRKAILRDAASKRLSAKSYVKYATRRLRTLEDAIEGGRQKAASAALRMARYNLHKARDLADEASIIQGTEGRNTTALATAIAKARKGVHAAEVEMQTKWPVSTAKEVGKGDDPVADPKAATNPAPTVTVPTTPTMTDLTAAMERIEAAAKGFGMLQADVQQLFTTFSGQSRNSATGNVLPPVFAIAKASTDELMVREAQIMKMGEEGVITFDDVDHARDVIGLIRNRVVPDELIQARIRRLPAEAQKIFGQAA